MTTYLVKIEGTVTLKGEINAESEEEAKLTAEKEVNEIYPEAKNLKIIFEGKK